MPTPRMDAVLQEQANYIHQFVTNDENTEENEDGKIWSNVLIVCKGKVGVKSLRVLTIYLQLSILVELRAGRGCPGSRPRRQK